MFDLNLGLPHAQNVLIAAIFLGIRIGYRDIVILGADHSWHESVVLDELNRVCLRDNHFYEQSSELKPFTIDGSPDNIFTIDELFLAIGRMFNGYRRLRVYANRCCAVVVNASSHTYIDAFTRDDIQKIVKKLDPRAHL